MKMSWFRRQQRAAELDAEIRHHLDEAIRDRLERGETEEQARLNARREFGNVGLVKETTREMWGWVWLEQLGQDVRFGLRMLRKHKGFTVIAVLLLALGIGANTTIFSAVESLILHPFSFPHQDRLVVIYERVLGAGVSRMNVTPGAFHDWRQQIQSFEQFASFYSDDFELTGTGQPEQLNGHRVSAGFFAALGVRPALGRAFQPEEDSFGHEQVVVLKHSLWERRFGSDPKMMGQTIRLNNKTYTVIGVMPREFNFPYNGGELWVPYVSAPKDARDRRDHILRVIGLLRLGVSHAQGDAEIRALSLRAQEQYPSTNSGVDAFTISLNEDYTRDSRESLPFMLGAAVFVLLIACANVANLLLARGAARQRELAVRMALGAGRWRVVRQLLTESLMLALMGGALGLGLSVWGVTALANSIPQSYSQFIPGWERLGINAWVLGVTVLASLVTGLLCGLLLARNVTQTEMHETLKEGGKGAASGDRNRWRNLLVVAEVALSLVLLIGAGLLIRSFIKILNTDPGFNPDNTMAMEIRLPSGRYPQPAQRANLYQELLQRVSALPGVAAVGLADGIPPGGWSFRFFQVVGQPPFPKPERTGVLVASPGYFAAVRTSLRAGRMFTDQDDANAPRVVLVNEEFARRQFAQRSAIGQRIALNDSTPYEIVGIVANNMNSGLDNAAEDVIYLPFAQHVGRVMALIVRGQPHSSGEENVAQVTGAIRRELAALDANLPVSEAKMLREAFRERSSPKRVITALLGIFALLALVMATLGLYAVMSFTVAQRTHEIGIRMALGAQMRDVLMIVVRQGLYLVSLGIIIGLIGAFAVTRYLSQMLYGVTAADSITYAMVAGLLLITAFIACLVPARRATKVDPQIALRHE